MRTIYIAHAGGAYNGYAYTNAKEAFINADHGGFRYAEIDFCRTADGDYAAIHDWHTTYKTKFKNRPAKKVPTAQQFLDSTPIHRGTSLTLMKGFEGIINGTNLRILIDAKHDLLRVCEVIRRKFPSKLDRIIPQAFTFNEYKKLKQYFPDVILILYRSRRTNHAILKFCETNKPFAIGISSENKSRINLSDRLQTLKIRAFCHTINDEKTAMNFQKKGFCGFYTDILSSNGKKIAKI